MKNLIPPLGCRSRYPAHVRAIAGHAECSRNLKLAHKGRSFERERIRLVLET